jgi:hypothetical protein
MINESLGMGGLLPNRIIGPNGKQALAVSDGYGRYVDAVLRGNVYYGANLLGTPVTTQAGLSATTPALALYNPQGSNVVLALYNVGIAVTSSPAGAVGFCLAANSITAAAPTNVTNATIYNALQLGGQVQGKGQCYRIATLAAAPVAFRTLGCVTGASSISPVLLDVDLAGSVVLEPGACISIQSTAAAAIVAHVLWEEIPLAMAA